MKNIKLSMIAILGVIFMGCGGGSGSSSTTSPNSEREFSNNLTMILDVDDVEVSYDWLTESGFDSSSASLQLVSDGSYGKFTILDNEIVYTKTKETNASDSGEFEIVTDTQTIPIRVSVKSLYWREVKCGTHHTVALKSDGTLWSWGYNNNGELGDSTNTNRLKAVQESTKSNNWRDIDAGGWFSLGVKEDGKLWAWGHNDLGQFGDGSYDSSNRPKEVSSASWKMISTQNNHVLALQSDNTLWAWGSNIDGQIGDGSTNSATTPYQIDGKWRDIATGENHSMAIREDGRLYAWGSNSLGQLGTGSTSSELTPTPIGEDVWSSVVAGEYHTLGIRDDKLFGWGMNGFGALTNNSDGTDEVHSPKEIDFDNLKKICGGSNYTLAIKENGTLWGWGNNQYAQLGTADWSVSVKTPTQEATKATDWVDVDCGTIHSVGIKSDGTLWIWGSNEYGELGNGTTNSEDTPIHILGRGL